MKTRSLLCSHLALFAIVASGLMVGCSKSPEQRWETTGANVKGTVTVQGKPLPLGRVILYGSDNKSFASATVKDGKYFVRGAPLGDVTIAVQTRYLGSQLKNGMPLNPADLKQLQAANDPESKQLLTEYQEHAQVKKMLAKMKLPSKRYENPTTSRLRLNIKKGNQEHNLSLTTG